MTALLTLADTHNSKSPTHLHRHTVYLPLRGVRHVVHLRSVISSTILPHVSIKGGLYFRVLSTDCSMAMCAQKACLRGHTRDSGTQSQIPAGSIWLFLRSTCMQSLKRRVANSSCCDIAISQWRYRPQKHVSGVVLATRERNRKSQPALCYILFGGPASPNLERRVRNRDLRKPFVIFHFLINISNCKFVSRHGLDSQCAKQGLLRE